jgi:polyhydroxyalkanoate synthesis regulator phasin
MQELLAALQELWSKALLARSTVEEQAEDLVDRIREQLSPDAAKELAAEVASSLRAQRQRLSAEVEAAVRRGLRLPSPKELKDLSGRLDEIEARIADLSGKENSPG